LRGKENRRKLLFNLPSSLSRKGLLFLKNFFSFLSLSKNKILSVEFHLIDKLRKERVGGVLTHPRRDVLFFWEGQKKRTLPSPPENPRCGFSQEGFRVGGLLPPGRGFSAFIPLPSPFNIPDSALSATLKLCLVRNARAQGPGFTPGSSGLRAWGDRRA